MQKDNKEKTEEKMKLDTDQNVKEREYLNIVDDITGLPAKVYIDGTIERKNV